MNAETVLAYVEERGLSITIDADGSPKLHGPREEATPALLNVLKIFRVEVIERIKAQEIKDRPKECLWANGYVSAHWYPNAGWPVGARCWRCVGDVAWKKIPNVEWGPLPVPDGVEFAKDLPIAVQVMPDSNSDGRRSPQERQEFAAPGADGGP